ncbi:MAG: triose-phosphate isomerase [Fretibacterium sp.]|nr:triose-phosphate isomerase [Fretibacterium sp.]
MKKIHLYGNWKMNMTCTETGAFFKDLLAEGADLKDSIGESLELAVFPPFTSLWAAVSKVERLKEADFPEVLLGAQNVYFELKGAFTGEVSFPMLNECGCTHVILGHSERRHVFGESEELIHKKVAACLDAELTPVLCYGEKLEEREGGKTFEVMERQLRSALAGMDQDALSRIVYAYEPVWAIGTGRSATSEEAQEVCAWTKKLLAELGQGEFPSTVLYGGSVSAANARELFSMQAIDGGLVGGASLKAKSFLDIYRAYVN